MSIRHITIERRMNPNRYVAVYLETDTSGAVITRFEQDVNIASIEAMMGIPRRS